MWVRGLLLLAAAVLCACGEDRTPSGGDPMPIVDTCGTITSSPSASAAHVSPPEPIVYAAKPPSSGPHRPQWARWGEYTSLPPEHWLHNLEHGGAAFLYQPALDPAVVEQLRQVAKSRPEDGGGRFRYVLAPFPDLPEAIGVVTWEWIYRGTCVDHAGINRFLNAHYRKAPEDIAVDGIYADGFIGR